MNAQAKDFLTFKLWEVAKYFQCLLLTAGRLFFCIFCRLSLFLIRLIAVKARLDAHLSFIIKRLSYSGFGSQTHVVVITFRMDCDQKQILSYSILSDLLE